MPALKDIHIAASPLTDRIYIGTVDRSGKSWAQKHDATSTFIAALMDWTPPGTVRMVADSKGGQYEIEVRKLPTQETPDEHR